ncbi:MAG TPA: hypothetical protein VJ654_18215 [Noviherbaspirillum sp.]|nr:hypothetical protein [Noviherbaspirillum sp.]
MTKETAGKSASAKAPAAKVLAVKAPAAKPSTTKPASKGSPIKSESKPKATIRRPAPAAKQAGKLAVKPAVKPITPAKAEAPARPQAELKEKAKKAKLVRDSFTMPEAEYAVLGEVKKACLKAGIEVKKSELLRVGVALIRQLDTTQLKEILSRLPALKAGRPKKSK